MDLSGNLEKVKDSSAFHSKVKIKGFTMDTIWGRGTVGDDTTARE
jgi:hypothetical protein